jgi:tetratricopeptide (TPR) repeat protein
LVLAADARKVSELPKRKPLPSTCVAIATLSEHTAAEPNCAPADRDRLRDQARQAYQQALEEDPNYLPAQTGLAHLYIDIEDYDRAVATFQKAIQSHPKESSLHYELGMCYARRKMWDPAVEHLRQATIMDPEQRLYSRTLGFCLARAGRYEESLTAFARLEGDAVAHYNLARMLHHLHQDDLSKQHLQQALELKPGLTPAQELLNALAANAAPVAPPGDELAAPGAFLLPADAPAPQDVKN